MTMNDDHDGQARLVDGGDPEWVADLFDTMRSGDLEVAVTELESLLKTMRRAAKARRMLTTVNPRLIRAGLRVSASRQAVAP
jgi:hypothetical protein